MNALDVFRQLVSSDSMTRRRFIQQQLKGALLVGAGLALPRSLVAAEHPDLGIAVGGPGPATRKAVELVGGIGRFVKSGQKVVIKPNMSFTGGPDRANTTHPEVVRELVALCKEAGAGRVRVLDHPLRSAELCIEGVRKVCGIFDEEMVYGLDDDDFFKPAAIPNGKEMKETDVMQDVLEADVLIAAPVAKSHGSAGVSLSMKGMMGLVYNRWVMHVRYDLHESIVDLASLLKPQLTVIDATRVLSTDGPSGPGKVLRPNTVIASHDMVAADAQAIQMFEWYGRRFAPRQVKHVRIAHERGLGRMDVENLTKKEVRL